MQILPRHKQDSHTSLSLVKIIGWENIITEVSNQLGWVSFLSLWISIYMIKLSPFSFQIFKSLLDQYQQIESSAVQS